MDNSPRLFEIFFRWFICLNILDFYLSIFVFEILPQRLICLNILDSTKTLLAADADSVILDFEMSCEFQILIYSIRASGHDVAHMSYLENSRF